MLSRVIETVSSLAILEHDALQNYGEHLGHKHSADEQQQELGLEQNGDCRQRSAESQRPRVAHENLGGMGVVPEEPDTRAHQRGAEYSELPRAAQKINVQVLTGVDAPDYVRVEGESQGGNC